MESLEKLVRAQPLPPPQLPFPGIAERNALYDSLTRLGNFYELAIEVKAREAISQLKKFESKWVQYNPYKPQNPRFGLSVTSLDGQFGGKPDLYSLREYNRREGTHFRESDFRTFTEVLSGVSSVQKVFQYFSPYVGRSHFLRFSEGGYFPPHRDGAGMDAPDTFRLLVPISLKGLSSHYFMLGDRPLPLRDDAVYFLNTMLPHSLFSFTGEVIYLICNIILCRESVARVKARLQEK